MQNIVLTCLYTLLVGFVASQDVVFTDFQSDPREAIVQGFTNVYSVTANYTVSESRVCRWIYNETLVVATAQYTAGDDMAFIDVIQPRFGLSATGNGVELYMELQVFNVTSSDTGLSICVTAGTNCIDQPKSVINVTECIAEIDGSVSGGTTESPCGKGCTANFACTESYSGADVTAECQYDATWSPMIICKKNCPITESIECDDQSCVFTTTDNEIKFNETVSIDCGKNYRNDSSVTCGEDGILLDTKCTFECSGEVGASWVCPNCSCNPSYTDVLDATRNIYCEECGGNGTSNCTRNGWMTTTSCFVSRIEYLGNITDLHLFSDGGIAGTVIGSFTGGVCITAIVALLIIYKKKPDENDDTEMD